MRLRAGGRMVNFQDKGSRAERVWEARSEEARTSVVGWLAAVTVRFFLSCVQLENFPTG